MPLPTARRMFRLRSLTTSLLGWGLLCGAWTVAPAALAASASITEPVLLEADAIQYDKDNKTVTASGHVEITQGSQIVLADTLTYDQRTDVVKAAGNVRILQPDGNVLFADQVELKREMKTGVVDNFRARLVDNSLFAAKSARKINPDVTIMRHATYSPCKVEACTEAKQQGKAPLWQMQAEKIRYDTKAETVTYKNAWMEVYGVPVAYTPYMRHATPNASAKQGFLMPDYSNTTNLGLVVRAPYYIPLAPNYDATLTPIYTSKEGPVLAGQYRHLLTNGYYELNGSITNPDRRDDAGNLTTGQELRGHINGQGRFQHSNVWSSGFDVNRATDDTYMRKYRFGEDLTLTSRAYVEGVKGRTYANAQALAFQGLEATDDPGQEPYALPYAQYETESKPGWRGSRWRAKVNTLAVARSDGTDTRRMATEMGWKLPVVTRGGHVLELDGQLRTDAYNVSDKQLNTGESFSGSTVRAVPQASATWRYPLTKPVGSAQLLLEPIVGAAISPTGINSEKIANEDSQISEFSDTNLMSFNRFTGYDLIESGTRGYYALHNALQLKDGTAIDTLFGQNYQQSGDANFPFTNSFNEKSSDYVGRVSVSNDWAMASYRFRLDQQDMRVRRNEVSGYLYGKGKSLGLDYISLNSDPFLSDREELLALASAAVSDQWTISAYGRRDLVNDTMVEAGAGITFANECLQWFTGFRRQFTRDRDIQPDAEITTQILLKNIN